MTSNRQRRKIQKTIDDAGDKAEQVKHNSAILLNSHKQILGETESLLTAIGRLSPAVSYLDKTYEATSELEWSKKYLTDSGVDFTKLKLEDLLTKEDIAPIELQLNRPLIERLQWDQWDYYFVFAAAIAGMIADVLFGDPTQGLSNMVSEKDTWVRRLFENIHKRHSVDNSIDYQGPHFGGHGHRLRSIGHDLFGFVQGISQIKNGTFTGIYYDHGKAYRIFSRRNQFGKVYEQMDFGRAIWEYTLHCFCDFFSPMSLPVPGFGYLARMPNRDIRKFAADMYEGGYNFRHMIIQGVSVVAVETIIRTYFHLRMRESDLQYTKAADIKLTEMLLLSHSLVTAFNCGKIIIFTLKGLNGLLVLNLPQILAVGYYLIPWTIFRYRNDDKLYKAFRNIEELKTFSEIEYLKTLDLLRRDATWTVRLEKSPVVII